MQNIIQEKKNVFVQFGKILKGCDFTVKRFQIKKFQKNFKKNVARVSQLLLNVSVNL